MHGPGGGGGRLLGLIGGMSWESSAAYYALLNRGVRDRLGGMHSARTLMLSVDFADVAAAQHAGDWDALAAMLAGAARTLEAGGAGAVMLCTNTMHAVAPAVEAAISVPLLHIADPVAAAARAAGVTRLGLLGTAFTMERPFLRERLAAAGLDVIVPDEGDRATVHRVIYDELVRGRFEPASRDAYCRVIDRLGARGAQGVVLGCTEIGLLVRPGDAALPLLDTAALHAAAGADWLLSVS